MRQCISHLNRKKVSRDVVGMISFARFLQSVLVFR